MTIHGIQLPFEPLQLPSSSNVIDRSRYEYTDNLNWPKISLVTPSYNQGAFLEETIRSVLTQGYPGLEYIIIDGGSKDNSVEIIRKYEKLLTTWVSEADKGQADAINKGFARSTGELLCWLNSDDLLYPGALFEIASQFIRNPNLDLVYGDVDFGVSTSNVERRICGRPFDFLSMFRRLEVPVPQQGSIWRRSAFDKVGGLSNHWQVVLDQDLFIRLADQCNLLYVPKSLGLFRDHKNSKSSALKSKWIAELPALYEAYFEQGQFRHDIEPLKAETTAVVMLTCGSLSAQLGNCWKTIQFVSRAFLIDPIFPFRLFIREKLLNFFIHSRGRVANQSKNII